MYAQLGDIVFEPLSGFNALGDNQDAVIAEYGLLEGKPLPRWMAPGLREITIGMRLHQRFIIVENARAFLRSYLENGTVVSLIWGTGKVEGRWLVASISTNVEESDNLGNVYCLAMGVTLKEVPAEYTLKVLEAQVTKAAFGIGAFVAPVLPVRPEAHVSRFVKILRLAVKYANIIRGLAYGGAVPGASLGGGSLTTVVARAHTNLLLLQQHYGIYGSDYDVPDMTAEIGASVSALETLSGIDPSLDPVGFAVANGVYQSATSAVVAGSYLLTAREVTRSTKMIF